MAGEVGVLGTVELLADGGSWGNTVSRCSMAVNSSAKLASTTAPKPPAKNHITPTCHHGTEGSAAKLGEGVISRICVLIIFFFASIVEAQSLRFNG